MFPKSFSKNLFQMRYMNIKLSVTQSRLAMEHTHGALRVWTDGPLIRKTNRFGLSRYQKSRNHPRP